MKMHEDSWGAYGGYARCLDDFDRALLGTALSRYKPQPRTRSGMSIARANKRRMKSKSVAKRRRNRKNNKRR